MPGIRSLRLAARGTVCSALGAGAFAACATPAVAGVSQAGFGIVVWDVNALPGKTSPDAVSGYLAGPEPNPLWSVVTPGVSIFRGGALLKGPASGIGDLDLAPGDEIRVVNIKPGAPATTLGTFIYQGLPKLETPVCAGSTVVSGASGAGATPVSEYGGGDAVLWRQLAGPVELPIDYPFPGGPTTYLDYPGGKPFDNTYPGWQPGFTVDDAFRLTATASSADRFTLTAPRPLVAGMHLYHWGGFDPAADLEVSVVKDELVVDCSAIQLPAPTPAITPAPTPVPDTTAPRGAAAAPTPKQLGKLGAKKLLRGGVPLTLTVDGPAQLKGTIALLGGKKPVVANVAMAVKAGKTSLKVIVPNALRKAVKRLGKAKTARLQLRLSLVDQAGNATRLNTITIKLPKR